MNISILLLAILVAFASGRSSDRDSSAGSAYRASGTSTDRDRESERLSGQMKAVRVKGEFKCGNDAAVGVRVKLWAKETDLEPSTLLARGLTDTRGAFTLEGDTQNKPGITEFEPVLTVYHNCNYDNKDKLRRVLLKVPSAYVSSNRFGTRDYNIGKMNLELIYPKETHERIDKVDQLSLKRMLMKMFF